MSRLFTQGEHRPTLDFDRSPLLIQPIRRRLGRSAWFAFGVAAGLLVELLAR